MMTRWRAFAIAMTAMVSVAIAPICAQAKDPALPPGLDPAGTPIAIISIGVDYTDPLIAKRLARDGEGQLIGWDFVDDDIAPFSSDPHATQLAKLLLDTYPDASLVIARINPQNPKHLANAAAFVARTPARIVAVPDATGNADTWALFSTAARQSPNTLFVLTAGNEGFLGVGTSTPPNTMVAATLGSRLAWKSAPGRNVDATVDFWVVPQGATMEDAHVSGPPTTNAQAVVMTAARTACVHDATKPAPANTIALRKAMIAQKRPLPHDPRTIVLDPMCWSALPSDK